MFDDTTETGWMPESVRDAAAPPARLPPHARGEGRDGGGRDGGGREGGDRERGGTYDEGAGPSPWLPVPWEAAAAAGGKPRGEDAGWATGALSPFDPGAASGAAAPEHAPDDGFAMALALPDSFRFAGPSVRPGPAPVPPPPGAAAAVPLSAGISTPLSTAGLWDGAFIDEAIGSRSAGAPLAAGSGGAAGAVVGALTGGSYFAWLENPPVRGFTAADFTGDGQSIVVIDDGFSNVYDQSNLVFHFDFRGPNDPSAEEATADSHGSWVAQTAVRVAPEVSIIHLQVMRPRGFAAPDDIEEALNWAAVNAEKFNIAAVNLSIGFGSSDEVTADFATEEYAALDARGVLVIVAAGNDGRSSPPGVNILAADDKAIAVSASDAADRLASFSQHGPGLTDIFALGVDVPATKTDGDTEFVDGTSFAAPYVSGIAALLQEASETINGERLSDDEFLEILQASARPLNTTAPVTDPGYRVADAEAALEYFIANAALYDDDPLTG